MDNLRDFITSDGRLDSRYIHKRQTLYQGMNGNLVERFYTAPDRSYIFKPLTHPGQDGRESWVYEHILPRLPAIYPRMLARSGPQQEGQGWSIFEDLGPLSHEFDADTMLKVVKEMAFWHAFPQTAWPADLPLVGQKPRIESIVEELRERQEEASELLTELGLPGIRLTEELTELLQAAATPAFQASQVLCHGDLHLGNFALAGDKLFILDWEHAHLNTPYWDLYHVLDMSHPLFPKQMTPILREQALNVYASESSRHGKAWDMEKLRKEYCLFAAVFSVWMLLLIRSDLKRGKAIWPVPLLKAQWHETVKSLAECVKCLCRREAETIGYLSNYTDKVVGE
ncbi:aminoglycoside phosphotransferase family protein [Paenibacillus sp. J22TS3]|uniref:aminoglycoside phosphotransferase family protein n=1 Tax=Paenibacillus sp. J22TS3 TaxID=2807192 RepID=UPI001B0CEFF4|nr:aminoglycoside phosphotransferase family protein [Paenibacillus sp. J22TS3]GIP24210.1 hypothetical protein J22TS3_44850 [Paenibacillus sp. J22TS3]